jgi:membrane protein YdbS with pleckstrin-like domain
MPAYMRLGYSKTTFLPPLLLLSMAAVFLVAMANVLMSLDLVATVFAGVVAFILVLFVGVSPFLASHEIAQGSIILRQGWLFKAKIPLSEVSRIEEVENGPLRTGVFFELRGSSLYVTTQRHRLIMLRLRNPRRFGYALGKRADRVYFDTTEHTRAVRALSEMLTPASPARASASRASV